jgi:hypothetical protein
MTIQCHDLAELVKACALLVKEGLQFKADTSNMLITLTGGH